MHQMSRENLWDLQAKDSLKDGKDKGRVSGSVMFRSIASEIEEKDSGGKRMLLAVKTDLFEISLKIGQAMRLEMDLEILQPL